MRIKELNISNFRNIRSLKLSFQSNVSIISGKNELGKSNALNALCWFTTGTILTDKWGSGENDIDSIIPIGAVRGINPEVSVIMDTGTKYTKKYISQWSKDGSKVKGHTTEWYINDVPCKNESEFNESIYPFLHYEPKLKTKDVNELRLFVDPLYALQKLDAKALRALLVDLGCSVSNEELYKKGFEALRPYGEKYQGKWDVMRKALKDESKAYVKEIESLQAKLETVADIEEYDNSVLQKLNAEYEALISKKTTIQNGGTNPQIAEFEKKLEAIKASINTRVQEHYKNTQEQRVLLEQQKQLEIEKLNNAANSEVAPLREESQRLANEIERLNTSIKGYEMTISAQNVLMKQYVLFANNINDKKTNLSTKLETVRTSEFKGIVTCPVCGSDFPASPEELAKFEKHKKEEIDSLIKEISGLEKQKESYKEDYTNSKQKRDETLKALEVARTSLNEANEKKLTVDAKIMEASVNKPVTNQALEDIQKKIAALDLPIDLSKEYAQANELDSKIQALKQMDQVKIQDKLNEFNIQINELNNKISEEYVKKSKSSEKVEYMAKLEATQAKLNETESLLARVNELIKMMISLINEKATEKTGLTFVMLEENLSNDGIKEVCYTTIDGIPFKDVNTAKKIKYGVFFIEKLKELLGHNELPILADRMEGIDDIEKIKTMTKEQLICTRVTEGVEIQIC